MVESRLGHDLFTGIIYTIIVLLTIPGFSFKSSPICLRVRPQLSKTLFEILLSTNPNIYKFVEALKDVRKNTCTKLSNRACKEKDLFKMKKIDKILEN